MIWFDFPVFVEIPMTKNTVNAGVNNTLANARKRKFIFHCFLNFFSLHLVTGTTLIYCLVT